MSRKSRVQSSKSAAGRAECAPVVVEVEAMDDGAAKGINNADTLPAGPVTVFQYGDTVEVRVAGTAESPLFVASDVCRILDLGNVSMAVSLLDEDEKGISNVDTLGGSQKMCVVTESGLYSLIFRSRKAEAKKFRRWVTGEVLPSLRKTGGYVRVGVLTRNGEGEVEQVRGLLLGALLGLESGEITIQRASVTAKLAGQYLRTWQLTLESRVAPEPVAEVKALPHGGTDEEWELVVAEAVKMAVQSPEWARQGECEGKTLIWFAVSSEQLALLCEERHLLPALNRRGGNVSLRLGMGLAARVAGATVPVPGLGLWRMEGWRSREGRGWQVRRIAPPEGA